MTSRGSTNNGDRYGFPGGTLLPPSANNQSGYTFISKVKILTDGVATLTNGELTGIDSLVANSITANIIIGNIVFPSLTPSTALTINSINQLTSSITTDTELSYVHGVTSSIQTQLNSKLVPSNLLGTSNEIVVTPSGSNLIISIANNAQLPGTGSLNLPKGSVIQRSGVAGSIRFNTDSNIFETTTDGATWNTIETSGTGVTSVTGTTNVITVSPTSGNCVVNISPSYVGQTSLTTLGTISTGTWQGSLINPTYGGTGVNNGANTLTLAGSLATSGAFTSTFTMTAATAVTFPTSGTLATTAQIPSITPAALTEVNDTNVTLTLGGTPNTALLQAASITAGWTGTLAPTRGGTGVNNGANTLTLAGSHALAGAFTSTFTMTAATAVTFPTSGTLATTTQLPTPAALTEVNDTNVTLTLGGTPSTALLQAASITAGWTGTLAPTRGGTGVNNGANTLTLAGSLATAGAFTSTFTMTAATAVTFPTSGTLATTTQLPTPAALTEVNDTNVTLTLGGTPNTALLQAASITAGWTGTLAPTRGGTGVNNGANTLTLAGSHALAGAFTSTFTMTAATAVTFPTSGTLATTTQLPTPAALTEVNDTNVTLTLGGTPSTALLQAASITAGWTGTLAIPRGGTGVGSVTTAPAATAWAGWDANSNLSANNFNEGYTTTVTAAGTTTLSVGSANQQYFTGTNIQTVVMPVASTLVLGQSWDIVNNSTGSITVQSSGLNTIVTLLTGTTNTITCILISGTTAASWEYSNINISTGNLTTSGVITDTSTIDNGIAATYLIIAGGGGGGGGASTAPGAAGGGGGAGGRFAGSTILTGSYAVVVGSGGGGGATGSATGIVGTSGNNSSLGTFIAVGGGGGAPGTNAGNGNGVAGGSGGGATGSTGTIGSGNAGSGNSGGTGGIVTTTEIGGGGGGSGSVGSNSSGSTGGAGGSGSASTITGSSVTSAGGGGGGGSTIGGAGGTGGGGSGAGGAGAGGNATLIGSGGGGGGTSGVSNGGSGSGGVVIISYTSAVQLATGGTITTSGGNFIHTFSSNGTFTVTSSASISVSGGLNVAKSLVVGTTISSVSGTFAATGSFQTLYSPNIPSSNIVSMSDGAGTTCGMFNVLVLASGVGQVVGLPSINLNWQFSGAALQFQTVDSTTPTLTWSAVRFL